MFVSKINGLSNLGFKGYQHIKNDIGESIYKFNYPYNSDTENCEVQIFKVVKTDKLNHKVIETPIANIALKPEGTEVNLQSITNLDKDEPFAYKIVRKDKKTGNVIWEGPDTGVKLKPGQNGEFVTRVHNDKAQKTVKDGNGNYLYSYEISDFQGDSINNYKYTLVSRKGTTPTVQGAGYLAMPDSFKPGVMYRGFTEENTGELYYNKDYQKDIEGVVRTFSNKFGGNIAGLQERIPYLKENGYKLLFTTPIANGDTVAPHSYWNKNNMQIAPNMGNIENFNSFFRDLYKNGMKYVYDGTFTSEGLEGIHFQYALRWAEKNPQSYYWFRMNDLKNSNLGLGVIPQNKENLRHRLVNAPYNYELQANGTYKAVANSSYDKNKETLFQIYDASQVTSEQVNKLDTAIKNYENIKSGKPLDINSHDDTLMNYVFQIDPKEYADRIKVINDLNKNFGKNIKLDSADGTIMAGEFSNFKIDRKTEGGFVTWDANTDMVKMNYHISGYDEKLLQAIVDPSQRDYERKLIERGTKEVQDMAMQAGRYWTAKVRDVQTMYIAQTVKKAKTVNEIDQLITEGKLPKEAKVNENVVKNILNGHYLLEPKGVDTKEDVTTRALMKLPLDTLEFAENTVGVLSTSYFSNRATTDETIGVSRFELMKEDNPHLVEPYQENYNRVNEFYSETVRDFAENIIKKVNDTSDEKLIDSAGNYTEYGEYVINLVGQDIAKYAFLKSLAGDNLKTKILKEGEITYDYNALQDSTSLKQLGIVAHNPKDEASLLTKKIAKGLNKLGDADIEYVASSISQRIKGTDTVSFRLAEAITERSGLGLDWRLDAAKDVMDMDATRNGDNDFDDNWNEAIKFWGKFVEGVKAENPNSYIVAEITDIDPLMKEIMGSKSCPYMGLTDIGGKFNGEPDAMAKFFNETGITSEAGYSYFYTDLLKIFAPEFETGTNISPNHDSFKNRFDLLLQTRSADYLRNLYTFMGNHDKPRLLHGLALDMGLFHSPMLNNYKDFNNYHEHRLEAIKVLSGAEKNSDIPIELRLNVDNNNYFRTINPRAVAMSKLILDSINEDLDKIANEDDKNLLRKALIDLTNGNYLGEGYTHKVTRIKIDELSSINNAFETILKMAEKHGLKLNANERKQLLEAVVTKANSIADSEKYLVHGDFDWTNLHDSTKTRNAENAKNILGFDGDYNKYSLYTIQLANLIKDSYLATGLNPEAKTAINNALKDFAEKYDKNMVNENTKDFKKIERPITAMRKNAYAARDIKLAIQMAIKQAEYASGKEIKNKEQIVETIHRAVTEPALTKASMVMEYLKGLPGNPTLYAGDELAMSGYEEKAKNVYLQNRNALPWSELDEDGLSTDYRKVAMSAMNGALKDRSNPELASLNNGTPYMLDVCNDGRSRDEVARKIAELDKEIASLSDSDVDKSKKETIWAEQARLRKNFAKIAYMMQSANGDATISLFNVGEVEHKNRVDYFAKYGLDTEEKRKRFFEENNIESINPNNKYVPIQPKSEVDYIMLGAGVALPVGTVFINANAKDTAKYIVKEINGKLGIFREGGKIIMDGKTAKNGVMILKKLAFKGNRKTYYNSQFNIVSNPYKVTEQVEEGKKLSLISR